MIETLLWLDRHARANRWNDLGPRARLGVLIGVIAAFLGTAMAGNAWLQCDVSIGREARVQSWMFWCMMSSALVFGYTSFEVLYRDPVWRRLSTLPVSPRALFTAKALRVYRLHLPLTLLPAVSGIHLLFHSGLSFWLVAVIANALVVVIGLSVSIYAHIWAGASLVDGANALKAYLSQGYGPTEAAFLFYSPALALLATAAVALGVEISFLALRINESLAPLAGVVAVGVILSLFCLRRASAVFIRWYHLIGPRFTDVEVVPPWREGEQSSGVLGLRLGALLPGNMRSSWGRLITQYRRRYRVLPPLQFVLFFVLLYVASHQTRDAFLVWSIATGLGVIVCIPAFRACGEELAFGKEPRALPIPRAYDRIALGLLTATEWAPLVIAVVFGGVFSGRLLEMGTAALGVAGYGVLINLVAVPASLAQSPRVARVSIVIRGVAVCLIGAVVSLL